MKIGIDILGGDYAPKAIVLGCILAHKELPEQVKLVLIGDKDQALDICSEVGFDASVFEFVHTTEFIEMGEHPAKAFQKKQNSSLSLGFGLLKAGKIDGFASAGNTGAMLVGALYTVKAVDGVLRPAIGVCVPRPDGKSTVLLDVGLNADCKPDVLYQFGLFGAIYAKYVLGYDNPRVGLLNIGEEAEKGNIVSQAAHQLMADSKDFNFIGNVEGTNLFDFDKVDVIVCEGFVGNVILKEAEAFYSVLKKRNINDEFLDRFNFENFGGTAILGVNAPVIIGHGISNDIAIKNMLLHTHDVIEVSLCQKFKDAFN